MDIGIKGGGLLDKRLRELAKKVSNPAVLRVGFLENATYPDGTSVAEVAAIQNFGAPGAGVPARPFFSKMVAERSPEWGAKLAKLLELNDYDAEKALALMGAGIAGQLRQAIVDMNAPPLSAVTIVLRKMRKDNPDLVVTQATVWEAIKMVKNLDHPVAADEVSDKPLVDTGNLLNSVDFEVESRG